MNYKTLQEELSFMDEVELEPIHDEGFEKYIIEKINQLKYLLSEYQKYKTKKLNENYN